MHKRTESEFTEGTESATSEEADSALTEKTDAIARAESVATDETESALFEETEPVLYNERKPEFSEKKPRKKVGPILPMILIASCLLLAILLIYPVIRQPEELNSLAELKEETASELSYVKVDISLLSDTGVEYLVNEKRKGRYYYAFKDDTCYIVRINLDEGEDAPATYENVTVTGTVYKDQEEQEDVLTGMAVLMNCPEEAIREKTCEYMIRE